MTTLNVASSLKTDLRPKPVTGPKKVTAPTPVGLGQEKYTVKTTNNKDLTTTITKVDSSENIVGTITLSRGITLKTTKFRDQLLAFSEYINGANIEVISGFRDQSKQNSLVSSGNPRAAKKSQHTVGEAADLKIPNMTAKQASIRAYNSKLFNRVNLYTSSQAIHVDQRQGYSEYYAVDWVKQAP